MQAPLISIIIDNFNYARFLEQCIDSALAQSYPHVEVIIVDDASNDGSKEIIQRFGERVLTVYQPVNRGQGAAFNAGFLASRGDIVMFLDADDWLYPSAAQRIADAWQPKQSKIHFRLDLVDQTGAPIDTYPAREVRLDRGDVVPLLLEFGRYETVVTSGNAFTRQVLERNLPIPEEAFRSAADGYLAMVVPFHGPVGCIEDCLGAYRVHDSNAYASGPAHSAANELRIRTRKFLEHEAHKVPVLRAKATEAGLRVSGTPHLRDPSHLELRLASLRLDPAGHPYKNDSRLSLAFRGFAASRRARLPLSRRVVVALWFLVVGLMPAPIAVPTLRWKMQPSSRPFWIDRNLKRVRRLLA